MEPILYHVYKVSEGGMGQDHALVLATEAGAKKVVRTPSYLVGHTAILVTATKRVHKKVSRSLFGR